MTNLPSQSSGAAPSGEECALVREALEYGVILATRQGDTHGFERAVAQASVVRPRCVIALPAGRALPPPPPFSPRCLSAHLPLPPQLRPYYEAPGSSETSAAADSRRQVLGLWLLHLLVTAARPQFYAEVELLSPVDRASAYISFVLQVRGSARRRAAVGGVRAACARRRGRSAWPSIP